MRPSGVVPSSSALNSRSEAESSRAETPVADMLGEGAAKASAGELRSRSEGDE